ncbi:MAG: type II toxin-antitoxin system VapC family toxin [Promethearchaeati archaeon SRVP18_Atabeyarchaeia-1]
MPFVADTHALVWYMTDNPSLSLTAKKIFQRADGGEEKIHIPCIVFFELLYLVEKGKVGIAFGDFVSMFTFSSNYVVEPVWVPVIKKSSEIPDGIVPDPWDRLIAATSMHLNLPLITRDRTLRRIGLRTIW